MRLLILALIAGLGLAIAPAGAWQPSCPSPSVFEINPDQVPATRAAVARGRLPILVLGGAATAGGAAGGSGFTYPARLSVRLRERLPNVEVTVTVRATPRARTADALVTLDADLADSRPVLVIWGPGGSAAARNEDLESFTTTVNSMITRTRTAHADPLLMSLQYAPSVLRVVNLVPYRTAVLNIGDSENVPVFDRYEFMRFWNAEGSIDLDATSAVERVKVARKLFDCMAEVLAQGIADAVR